MTDVPLGDIDPDDVFCDEAGDADPRQVARFMHETRQTLVLFRGDQRALPDFDDLPQADQDAAEAIGYVVSISADLEVDEIAIRVQTFVADFGREPAWEDLTDDEGALALDIISLVLAWLLREGTWV